MSGDNVSESLTAYREWARGRGEELRHVTLYGAFAAGWEAAQGEIEAARLQARLAEAEDRLGLVVEERNQVLQECDFALEGLQELQRQLAAERLAHGQTRAAYERLADWYTLLGSKTPQSVFSEIGWTVAHTSRHMLDIQDTRDDTPDAADLWQRAEAMAVAAQDAATLLQQGMVSPRHQRYKAAEAALNRLLDALADWREASPR